MEKLENDGKMMKKWENDRQTRGKMRWESDDKPYICLEQVYRTIWKHTKFDCCFVDS